jgi:hypothetical protein
MKRLLKITTGLFFLGLALWICEGELKSLFEAWDKHRAIDVGPGKEG